jgi:F-type H+-transporting ATPase subunit b
MPQLTQLGDVAFSQWFWLALVLAVLFFGVGRGMLPKIEATVDDRDKRIADDLAAAERARASADATEDAWRTRMTSAQAEAHNSAVAAKAKGAEDAAKRLAKADAAVGDKLGAAEAALNTARTKALASIESVASEAARDIVAKVSGAKISAADADRAVKGVLAGG